MDLNFRISVHSVKRAHRAILLLLIAIALLLNTVFATYVSADDGVEHSSDASDIANDGADEQRSQQSDDHSETTPANKLSADEQEPLSEEERDVDTEVSEEIPSSNAVHKSAANAATSLSRGAPADGAKAFSCTPGTYYSLLNNGTIQYFDGETQSWNKDWQGIPWMESNAYHIDPQAPSDYSFDYNSLGISPDGQIAYAVDRDPNESKTLYIRKFTAREGWEPELTVDFNHDICNLDGDELVSDFVGGAVNNKGEYFLFVTDRLPRPTCSGGAIDPDWTPPPEDQQYGEVRIYKYVPGQDTLISLGKNSQLKVETAYNGDFAFDSLGNLHIVVSSLTADIQLLSFSPEDLEIAAAEAPKQQSPRNYDIPGTPSEVRKIEGFGLINGIAFDYDGNVFIGDTTKTLKINPVTGQVVGSSQDIANVDLKEKDGYPDGVFSTDLGSCTSPSTFTLRKNVVGRAVAGDQFDLFVRPEGQESYATVTTSGTDPGIQNEQILLPVTPGTQIDFGEVLNGSSDSTSLSSYMTTWNCTQQHIDEKGKISDPTPFKEGTGTGAQLTMPEVAPAESRHVTCTISNAPFATVEIRKVELSPDDNKEPGAGWTVSARAEGNGFEPIPENEQKKQTVLTDNKEQAVAVWQIPFTDPDGEATVTIDEDEDSKSDFEFERVSCGITRAAGGEQESPWDHTTGSTHTLPSIGPGDRISCVYYNKKVPLHDLTVVKRDQVSKQPLSEAKFDLYLDSNNDGKWSAEDTLIGQQTSDASGEMRWERLKEGTYFVRELSAPAGYQLMEEPIKIDVPTQGNEIVYIDNEKIPVPALPLTGGLGRDLFTVIGGLLVAGSLLIAMIVLRRRKI